MSTRWRVNITPAERVGRILLGLIGAVGGMLLLTGSVALLYAWVERRLATPGRADSPQNGGPKLRGPRHRCATAAPARDDRGPSIRAGPRGAWEAP